jgi:hypothetical protein
VCFKWYELNILIIAADKGTERERLFESSSNDRAPRLRTAEEVRAKYRKAGVMLCVIII